MGVSFTFNDLKAQVAAIVSQARTNSNGDNGGVVPNTFYNWETYGFGYPPSAFDTALNGTGSVVSDTIVTRVNYGTLLDILSACGTSIGRDIPNVVTNAIIDTYYYNRLSDVKSLADNRVNALKNSINSNYTCRQYCFGSCANNCFGQCKGACATSCTAVCSIQCKDVCVSGCSSCCITGCHQSCVGSCKSNCNRSGG